MKILIVIDRQEKPSANEVCECGIKLDDWIRERSDALVY